MRQHHGDGLDGAGRAEAWPVTPLMDVTGGPGEPNTLSMASASAASLSGVDVPWALMWTMSAAATPASASASSMQATAPAPPGDGAVMWWASAVLAPRRAPRPRIVAPRATACSHSSSTRIAGALGHHEAVAVERRTGRETTGSTRCAVMLVKPATPVSVSSPPRCRRRCTASQRPDGDEAGGVADRVRAGRAGGDRGLARALQAVPHRDRRRRRRWPSSSGRGTARPGGRPSRGGR